MPAAVPVPVLDQLNVVVADVARSVDFYRLLGLTIDEQPPSSWTRTATPSA